MKTIAVKILIFWFGVSVCVSCSHFQRKTNFVSADDIERRAIHLTTIDLSNQNSLDDFIKDVNSEVLSTKRGQSFSRNTWIKIGLLLELYKNLTILGPHNQISIPAQTSLTLKLNSFCLDPGRSAPDESEVFEWIPGVPSIPLYSAVLRYFASVPNKDKRQIQALIWNLSSGTYYENYPENLQKLLREIDPKAPLIIPSETRARAGEYGGSFLAGAIGVDLVNFVRGRHYNFEQFKSTIESTRSTHRLATTKFYSPILNTSLFGISSSEGFEVQTIKFQNFSDMPVTIDLGTLYLKPQRPDVQRIALASVIGGTEYYRRELEAFFKKILSEMGVRYPNLSAQEKKLIQEFPYESLRVAWYQNKSEYAASQLFEGGSIDGEQDAFRHFVWAGYLTHDLGRPMAERYLSAHESRDPKNAPDRKMDEHNNRKGVEAAIKLENSNQFTSDKLYDAALQALRRKDLVVLKPIGNIPDNAQH